MSPELERRARTLIVEAKEASTSIQSFATGLVNALSAANPSALVDYKARLIAPAIAELEDALIRLRTAGEQFGIWHQMATDEVDNEL